MPRRAVLSDEQRMALLALPDDETTLVQHWTLSEDDLAIIVRRRRPHNRLGFAIQLCALRYPGRPPYIIRTPIHGSRFASIGLQPSDGIRSLASIVLANPDR